MRYLIKRGLLITWSGAFISHDIEPGVCIRGFSFIFEVDFEEMSAFVSILRSDLTLLMSLLPDKCV